jgi:hypothetical protein
MSKKITQQERQHFAATADKLSTLSALLEKQTERTEAAALLAEKAAADSHQYLTMAIGSAECARDFCKCARAYKLVQAFMFWVTVLVTLAYLVILYFSLS